jgi:hypothetical protein
MKRWETKMNAISAHSWRDRELALTVNPGA